MDFSKMDISTISSGVSSDGTRYLQLFLKEFTSIFSETVNPGCPKCLTNYHNRYIKHMNMQNGKSNTSGYKLQPKYQNIQLEFGSPILVNDDNITEEYAKILLAQPNGERFFAQMPEIVEAEPEVPREDLVKKLEDAQNAFNALPDNAHHMKIKAAQVKVKNAEEALEAFDKKAEEDLDHSKNIELQITQDDLDRVPELATAGYKLGQMVLVIAKDYKEAGELNITNIIGPVETENQE